MTDAQTSALDHIKEVEGSDGDYEQLTYCTSGKWTSALGLVRYAEDKMLHDEGEE